MIKSLLNQNEMLRMRLDGESYQSIADKADVSRQRIQQLLSPPVAIRKIVVAKAKGRCECCGVKVSRSGHVHHIGNEHEDYQDIENLQLLCLSCHGKAHSRGYFIGKGTRAIGIRLSNADIEEINKRAARKGWSFNRWVNWSVRLGLRSHKKRGNNGQ